MVLDENVQNYFADVESIAFDPGVTVPGESSRCPHSQPVILVLVLLPLEQAGSEAAIHEMRTLAGCQYAPLWLPSAPLHVVSEAG